jgi:8-oxo-dGTP diphosphatase
METITRDIVAAYVVSADQKILFGQKDPNQGGVYLDCWHVPGGGIDAGETRTQALAREVLEETGIDITGVVVNLVDDTNTAKAVKSRPNQPDVLVKMTFAIYTVALPIPAEQVELSSGDDLINLTWFTLDELQTLQLTPPARDYFDAHGVDWLITQQ